MKNIFYKTIAIILIYICIFMNVTFAIKNSEENAPIINTNSYICYERNTKQVLFGEKTNEKTPMASTTKIMTCILALEYGKLDEMVVVSKNAQNITGWQLNLKEGDKIMLKDLLYAIMLYSANDGAIAIAEHIGGSVDVFCNMMNEMAKAIGMNNTNFISPHGLDNEMHYSTPYDLAILTDYAFNNQEFCKIVKTKQYNLYINGNNRNINNTNKLLNLMDCSTGVKTGYTGKAGYCLVSGAKTDKLDLICVTLGSNSSEQRFNESKKILEYAIEKYEIVDLSKYIENKIMIDVDKYKEKRVIIKPQSVNKIALLKGDKDKIRTNYVIQNNIVAPVKNNIVLCICEIFINEKLEYRINYSTCNDIEKNTYVYYIKYILNNMFDFLKIY